MLRRACAEGAKRLSLLSSDSGSQVDRRIVVKLLTTFFERGQSPDILNLMARMLGFTGTLPGLAPACDMELLPHWLSTVRACRARQAYMFMSPAAEGHQHRAWPSGRAAVLANQQQHLQSCVAGPHAPVLLAPYSNACSWMATDEAARPSPPESSSTCRLQTACHLQGPA